MSLISGLILAAALTSQTAPGDGNADMGRRLYEAKGCYACHGHQGQGALTGPKLAPDPIPVDAMRAFVRNSAGTMMPPYSPRVLSDAEIADIHAWLAKQPTSKDPSTIPLLQH